MAAPIQYTLSFDSTLGTGPNGSGSFTYDSATGSGSGLSWNFGGGEAGGVFDSLFTGNPGYAAFLFDNVLNNVSGDPLTSGSSFTPTVIPGSTFGFGEDAAAFCWGTLSLSCDMDNPGTSLASYRFVDVQGDGGEVVYRGYLTIGAINDVPEPSALALLLAAALAGGIVPAWQKRTATSAKPRQPRR